MVLMLVFGGLAVTFGCMFCGWLLTGGCWVCVFVVSLGFGLRFYGCYNRISVV